MNATVPTSTKMAAPAPASSLQSVAPSDISTLTDPNAPAPIRDAVLCYRVNQIIKQNEAQGVITGVDIQDLQTGQMLVSHNGKVAQYAASINKLPVALLLLQDLRSGNISLSTKLSWDKSQVLGGFGAYDQPGAPTTATVQQLIFDMLNHSGNTAVEILVNQELGGALAVNTRLEQYPKLVQTQLEVVGPGQFYLGNTTPNESIWVMEHVQRIHDPFERFMQHAMATNIFTDYGVRSQLAGNSYITLANKVGILDDAVGSGNIRNDVGIIYNSDTHRSIAYSFITSNFSNGTDLTTQAEMSLQQMGLDVLRFAGDQPKQTSGQTMAPFQTTNRPQYHEKKILY